MLSLSYFQDLMRSIPLANLPDKGAKFMQNLEELQRQIDTINARLKQAPVITSKPSTVNGPQTKLSDFFTYQQQQQRGPIQIPAQVMAYQYAGMVLKKF